MFWRRSTSIRQWLPKLQAHRGYWVEGLQQNSLRSVQEAYRRGYKMAEFDVRLTSDQVTVLFHDEHYQDTFLFQTSYDGFKSHISIEFPDLSKLEDVFSWMKAEKKNNPDFDFKLNVEIKSKKILNGKLENQVCQLIDKFNLADFVLISSFNPFALFRVRWLNSKIRRALLVTHSEESNFVLNSLILNCLAWPDVLHLRWNDLSHDLVNRLQGKVPIVLWTVNDLTDIKKFEGQIDGVISDRLTPLDFEKFKTAEIKTKTKTD